MQNWVVFNSTLNVWRAPLSVVSRQLFVDGVRAARPNRTAEDPEALGSVTNITDTGFLVTSTAP